MLRIRLTQRGKRHQRSYRIVVVKNQKPRDTEDYLADLGYWNRIRKIFKLDQEKYEKFLNQGAQPVEIIRQQYEKTYKKDNKLSKKLSESELIADLENLPENKIKIWLQKSNFKPTKIQGQNWELNNFSVLDLKNKLKKKNYQSIRKVLPSYWNENKVNQTLFKKLKIETIFSKRDEQEKMSVIKDDDKLSLSASPFNFEFSIATYPNKIYSTKNNPICIVSRTKNKEV